MSAGISLVAALAGGVDTSQVHTVSLQDVQRACAGQVTQEVLDHLGDESGALIQAHDSPAAVLWRAGACYYLAQPHLTSAPAINVVDLEWISGQGLTPVFVGKIVRPLPFWGDRYKTQLGWGIVVCATMGTEPGTSNRILYLDIQPLDDDGNLYGGIVYLVPAWAMGIIPPNDEDML